jgi:hypothetical protein
MECLNIDFVGPFPDDGYVFVIIDTFTRWVELYHTPDAVFSFFQIFVFSVSDVARRVQDLICVKP